MKPLSLLLDMLTYCRPCGSTSETAFIDRFIATLPNAFCDAFGNWHVKIDDTPILWSSHTDTVHGKAGRQTVHYDAKTGIVGLSRKSQRISSCLGADDTAGVFLMCEMIKRRVPGYYIFHFGEEVGGIGSGDLARQHHSWLSESFRCAIALDRGGYRDVITHQGGRMTSSVSFADSLAAVLNGHPLLSFLPSDRGIYTDTKEYANAIPECTNVSVGYFHAHSNDEVLDTTHLLALLEALCTVRLADLAIVRQPGEDDRPLVSERFTWADWSDWNETDLTLPAIDVHPTSDSLSDDEPIDRDVFLDRVYGDVQSALRRYRS